MAHLWLSATSPRPDRTDHDRARESNPQVHAPPEHWTRLNVAAHH